MQIDKLFKFLQIAIKLKQVKRAGWVRREIPNPESVADHTFGLCLLAFVFSKNEFQLSREKCVAMALVHDLAEAIIGDITPFDGISPSAKHQLERDAFNRFAELLDDNEIQEMWDEYCLGESPEAAFVKDLDKIEAILQASEYERNDSAGKVDLDGFVRATVVQIKTAFGKTLCREILSLREMH